MMGTKTKGFLYGVTGMSRRLTDAERAYLDDVVEGLAGAEEFFSGAAYGVDTEFIVSCYYQHRDVPRCLVLPAAPHNGALVEIADTLVRAPRKRDASSTYMARNDLLAACLAEGNYPGVLLAFPETRDEVRRGGPSAGTWATVRRARKAGVEVRLYPLNEVANSG